MDYKRLKHLNNGMKKKLIYNALNKMRSISKIKCPIMMGSLMLPEKISYSIVLNENVLNSLLRCKKNDSSSASLWVTDRKKALSGYFNLLNLLKLHICNFNQSNHCLHDSI